MVRGRRVLAVLRFEVAEAFRSRASWALLAVGVLGTALATAAFLATYKTIADEAREALSRELSIPLSELPDDIVDERVRPWLLQLVDEASTRELLSAMSPLSLFYSLIASGGVLALVLLACGGLRRAFEHGAARFELLRVSRLEWLGGMLGAQLMLVAMGLAGSIVATLMVGSWLTGANGGLQLGMLLRAALFALASSAAYVGVLGAVVLVLPRRLASAGHPLIVLTALWLLRAVITSDTLVASLPAVRYLDWLFPAHYASGIWEGTGLFWVMLLALFAIGGGAAALGWLAFERRDV